MTTPLEDPDVPLGHRKYLYKKTEGGAYGREGTEYEVFVAAFELIKLAQKVLSDKLDPEEAFITWQAAGMYIDDVVIRIINVTHHYEMKTGGHEYWGKALGTLRWNFNGQKAFNDRHRRSAIYGLVLSDPGVFDTLYGSSDDWVNVVFFPNTSKPTVINQSVPNFIQTIIEVLPFENQETLFKLIAGERRIYLEFDHNDVATAYQGFQRAFQNLKSGAEENFDAVLADVMRLTFGLLRYRARGFKAGVQEKLDKIDGITFVTFNGVVFFSSQEGIFGRAPIELGGMTGEVFQDLVLEDFFREAQQLRDYMEELEDRDD